METRRYGRTDLVVSKFGLGCARIGGIFQHDPGEFVNLLSAALDGGINFFDTADIYSQGESETLIGRAFRGKREQIVIASKAGYVLPAQRRFVASIKPLVRPLIAMLGLRRQQLPGAVRGALSQDFSPAYLHRAVEGSLRRLATDRLDLLQLHSPSAEVVARGEWIDGLEKLKQQGKIRYYGIACDSVDAALAAVCHPGVSSLQIAVNLLNQGAVDLVLPGARERGIGVIARECLANGLLVKDASAIDLASYCQSEDEVAVKAGQLEKYRRIAGEDKLTLAELALRFVSRLDGVGVSLIGVSRRQQLDVLLAGNLG